MDRNKKYNHLENVPNRRKKRRRKKKGILLLLAILIVGIIIAGCLVYSESFLKAFDKKEKEAIENAEMDSTISEESTEIIEIIEPTKPTEPTKPAEPTETPNLSWYCKAINKEIDFSQINVEMNYKESAELKECVKNTEFETLLIVKEFYDQLIEDGEMKESDELNITEEWAENIDKNTEYKTCVVHALKRSSSDSQIKNLTFQKDNPKKLLKEFITNHGRSVKEDFTLKDVIECVEALAENEKQLVEYDNLLQLLECEDEMGVLPKEVEILSGENQKLPWFVEKTTEKCRTFIINKEDEYILYLEYDMDQKEKLEKILPKLCEEIKEKISGINV